jgi:hypothetical protein
MGSESAMIVVNKDLAETTGSETPYLQIILDISWSDFVNMVPNPTIYDH